jgi:mono/diheme cytochrome c family protein
MNKSLTISYLCIFVVLLGATIASAEDNASAARPLHFESDIRPILKAHCFHCHGEEGHKEAGLDVRLVRFLKQGGESGAAIEPGQAAKSLLIQRVEANEMPPAGKSLSDAEKSLLRRWVEEGAATKRAEPDQPDSEQWTEEERSYWAFQPVVRQNPPILQLSESLPLEKSSTPQSPIDLFLLQPMTEAGLTFNPTAGPETLIRRLYLDLIGLQPTPNEVQEFVSDISPDAYEKLVDRLLADPRYGERWGRHWLDVAGYADSDGYTEQDSQRPWAFHYRDYVIRAHNEDRPVDRFVIEQLAGDELVPQPWENLSAENAELLAATGFLRTAPDGTDQEGVDNNVARNDVVAETIKIVSSSMLGMTVGCAQCHDHRYDPISQKDYFRLRAVFEPGLDWKRWRGRSARLVNLWSSEQRQVAANVDKEQAELEGKRVAELDTIVDDIFGKEVAKLPEEKRELAKLAKSTPADKRTPEHQQILKDYPSLNVDRGSATLYDGARINEFNKKYDDLKAGINSKRPPDNFVAAFSEVPNQAPVTYVFFRGDFNQPRDTIKPGGLSILSEHQQIVEDDPALPTSGRRLALAKHLTSGTHPLLTRAIVNRLWMHHFGKGLVASPADFGLLGERPTHPQLLDWLASELVSSGWSRKQLSRLMVTSAVYRQSSQKADHHLRLDPENRLLARMPVRRVEAEVIRDCMLQVSGMINYSMFGPAAAVNPDEVGQFIIGKATRDGNGILVAKHEESAEVYRRTMYAEVRRSMPLGMLEPFDPAALSPNCDRRSSSTVSTQSLLLMNNSSVIRLSEHFAQRVQREVGDDPGTQVRHAWALAFGTMPNDAQAQAATAWLIAQRAGLTKPDAPPTPAGDGSAPPAAPAPTNAAVPSPVSSTTNHGNLEKPQAEQQALALYCQALFSSNQFLYLD